MKTTRLPLLPAVVRERAQSTPDAPAVVAGGSRVSYADLHALVAALNGRLRHHGVRPGDRVAILGLNSIEWIVAFLACLDAGAVAAPLSYRLSPHELEQQIALLQPRLVLSDEEFLESVTAGARRAGSTLLPLTGLEAGPESVWAGRSAGAVAAAVTPSSHALISFTSGSTGVPKGAVITHEGLVSAAGAYVEAMGTSEDDRTLVMVPLFHNTGFCDQLAHMLLVGGTVDLLPAFGVAAAREALLRQPSTFLMGVPGILRLLATGEGGDEIFSACRIACYGGSPMPEAWIEDIARRWPHLRLYNSYGLTEFTSVSHLLDPGDLADHAGTVGRPVPGAQQRVVAPDGTQLPPGEVGSLLLAGPSRMKKYWRDRARTSEVIRGRWLVTGDLGSVERGWVPHARGPRLGGHQPRRREGQPAAGRGRAQPAARDRGGSRRRRPAPRLRRARGGVRRPPRSPRARRRGGARAPGAHGGRLRRPRAHLRARSSAPRLDRQGRPPRPLRVCRGGRRGRAGAP